MDKDWVAKTRRHETGALWARSIALAWTIITFVTFLLLGLVPQDPFSRDAMSIFIAGAVVTSGFLVGLVWSPWSDVEAWLTRVKLLLRWQVATGVVIAFSAALAVRPELTMPFSLYGFYLTFSAIPFAALSLIALRLRHLYGIRDQKVAEVAAQDARREERERLERLIAERRRPLIEWRRKPRKTETMQDPTQQQQR